MTWTSGRGWRETRRALALAAMATIAWAVPASAGGGPENVAVVVNADSWASLTVANEFIKLRRVPACNVVFLRNLPDLEQTPVAEFRSHILTPVFDVLEKRGLRGQIDYVVYSSDFPTAIDFQQDAAGRPLPKGISPLASITGLTYLYEYVLANDVAYLRLDANRYMRRRLPVVNEPPLGESEQKRGEEAAKLVADKKWAEAAAVYQEILKTRPRAAEVHYNLACCLALQQQGDAAMAALRAAVEAGWTDAGFILDDDDFVSLREREDFKRLVTELQSRPLKIQGTRGFRSAYAWNSQGKKVSAKGSHYLLSTMLAVTSGRGNSVREALAGLRRSASADGTRPKGTIYFAVNGDIRSTTRQGAFPAAVAALKELGVAAEVVQGVLPDTKGDVMGAMVGAAGFDWKTSKSTILPGAICEHLTSCGGMMRETDGQTPLAEFLRYGAAASSGTVAEPYAIQAKFPFAFLHVHYARGCTLAEAFYQSVYGPYQLLIVGDPLCRPWAVIPLVAVDGVTADQTVSGKLELRPRLGKESSAAIRRYELFVDGRRRVTCRPKQSLALDTAELSDGYHELRIVAISADAIGTQGQLLVPINVRNHGPEISVEGPSHKRVAWDRPVKLSAHAEGAKRIAFVQNGREIGKISGAEGQVEIDPQRLGMGVVQVQAVAEIGSGEAGRVISRPMSFEVVPPKPRPGIKLPAARTFVKGLQLKPNEGAAVTVEDTRAGDWLTKAGLKAGQAFVLEGYFDVAAEDVYQFQMRGEGRLVISVDEATLKQPAGSSKSWKFLPVSLAAGTHRLQVRGKVPKDARVELRFGGPGAQSLGAGQFRH